MSFNWVLFACFTLGLASALVGGVFQAFSDFVMRALIAAEPRGGIEAMQRINRTVFRSVFLAMMLGLAPLTIGFAVYAWFSLPGPQQVWISAAAIIYVVSVFFITMVGNVPMNNRLESLSYTQPETVTYWRTYGADWTKWNHVRTIGAIATAVCFLVAGAFAA